MRAARERDRALCPPSERLAAAASGQDAEATEHAMTCIACRRAIDDQRELIALVRRDHVMPLSAARRDELAAEVMAHSDLASSGGSRRFVAIAGVLAAAAAVVVVIATTRERVATSPELASPVIEIASEPAHAWTAREAAPVPERVAGVTAPREVVRLTTGEVSINASVEQPVTVIAGDTSILLHARAKVVARNGVIVTAHVFAGRAEIDRAGHKEIIEAGDVWTRDPKTVATEDALAAFRTGWEALRARHYDDAIAAFDRATDEIVAEDAAFWAAIAAERAGQRDEAARRLRAFLERFPGSPRADDTRSALDRVTR